MPDLPSFMSSEIIAKEEIRQIQIVTYIDVAWVIVEVKVRRKGQTAYEIQQTTVMYNTYVVHSLKEQSIQPFLFSTNN